MARNFAGGTDRIAYATTGAVDLNTISSIVFRFRTTQAQNGVQVAAKWSNTSRSGWALLLTSAGRLEYLAYSTTQQILLNAGATGLNDGNWHTVVANISSSAGGTVNIYVDGSLYATGTNASNYGNNGSNLTFGDSFDAFWTSYNGSLADVGYGLGFQLTADEIAAYNGGMSARFFTRTTALEAVYAPMVRDHQDKYGTAIAGSGFSGTTVVDHPRVIGSLV